MRLQAQRIPDGPLFCSSIDDAISVVAEHCNSNNGQYYISIQLAYDIMNIRYDHVKIVPKEPGRISSLLRQPRHYPSVQPKHLPSSSHVIAERLVFVIALQWADRVVLNWSSAMADVMWEVKQIPQK